MIEIRNNIIRKIFQRTLVGWWAGLAVAAGADTVVVDCIGCLLGGALPRGLDPGAMALPIAWLKHGKPLCKEARALFGASGLRGPSAGLQPAPLPLFRRRTQAVERI
ncbi:hypothetical protein GmRootV116_41920 [Variovorax sp. V116]